MVNFCSKKKVITVFLSRFSAFLESSLRFANHHVHLSKQFIQTAPQNGLSAKTCTLPKTFSQSLKTQ